MAHERNARQRLRKDLYDNESIGMAGSDRLQEPCRPQRFLVRNVFEFGDVDASPDVAVSGSGGGVALTHGCSFLSPIAGTQVKEA
jgi:hypothetical protein